MRLRQIWLRLALAFVAVEVAFIVISTVRDGNGETAPDAHPSVTVKRLVAPAPPQVQPTLRLQPALQPPVRLPVHVADASAFRYWGAWDHIGGRRDGRLGGKSSRTFKRGARATLTFRGRFVRLYGVVGPGGGFGAVRLDGVPGNVVDFFAPAKAAHRLVYASGNLRPGLHRLSLTVVPDPSIPGARTQYVNIEAAEYGS